MPTETTDRQGQKWKAYGNGRILCAATMPIHDARNADGTCDCLNVTGKTIAEFTWDLRNMKLS